MEHISALSSAIDLIAVCFFFAISYFIYATFSDTRRKFWSAQPWVGLKEERFAKFRAGFQSISNTQAWLRDGCKKYAKNGKGFVLPQLFKDPIYILPVDRLRTLLDKPDSEIDIHIVQEELSAPKYTSGEDIRHPGWQFDIVRRQLTRNLSALTADIHDELALGFDSQWGSSKDWHTIKAMPTAMKIISRAANRVFAGTELCRNDDFLENSRLYTQSVFKAAAIIQLIPGALRPLLAPLTTSSIRKHLAVCKRIAEPVIEQRLEHVQHCTSNKNERADALTWLVTECARRSEYDLDKICRRFLDLNMTAIHTTSIATTNTILDIYSSPHADEIVAGLREECERVLEAHGGKWSKAAVDELFRVESAIRESMRYSTGGLHSVSRTTIADVDLGNGITIPKGVRLAFPLDDIHHDENLYTDANTYDAFRFSRPREEYLNSGSRDGILMLKNMGLVTTSDTFLGFGHGRHACPGRFFASQEMKLMLAYIVTHYDAKIDGERPKGREFNGRLLPTGEAEIRIRRRQL